MGYLCTFVVFNIISGMASSKLLLAFPLILMHFLAPTIAQQPNFLSSNCFNDVGNYTAKSAYSTNLNRLLSSLSRTTEFNSGFYNVSEGDGSDKVNGIALCRGDVSRDVCLNCLHAASSEITRRCPNRKESIVWYDECVFRYSNRSIYGVMEDIPVFYLVNDINVTNLAEFNQKLRTLLEDLRSRATQGGDLRKFAEGNTIAPEFKTIFGLVQCTPDLTVDECSACLVGAMSKLPDCCSGKVGGRVVRPSCNLRYEIYRFYESTADTISPPPTTLPEGGEESNKSTTIIIIVVLIVSILVHILCICIYLRKRKRKPKKMIDESEDEISVVKSFYFDFSTIKTATNDFFDANRLGEGGFGSVFKGRLPQGQLVAVKRLAMGSRQGEIEFRNEVSLLGRLQHPNLVRLLGFCFEEEERILIYEFMPNTSLDHFLFDPLKHAQLDWESRRKIIGGIACGLLYLHKNSRYRIIHRDLKASNVLLDGEMNPRIADFGLAKLFKQMDETQKYTSRIAGTYGYMAPEHAMHGKYSVKTDVYSFGVLVLEIVSGQRNSSLSIGENIGGLTSSAWKYWGEGTASNLIDSALKTGSRNEMMRCVHVALLCVQENAADRPTMDKVVLMLNSSSLTLPVPSPPAFYMSRRSPSLYTSSSPGYYQGFCSCLRLPVRRRRAYHR